MTPPRRLTAVDLICLAGIGAVSALLRWWHLGSASLWWDELIHIGTAQLPSPSHVFQHARRWVGGVSVLTYDPLPFGPWAKEMQAARFPGIVAWEKRSPGP